MKLNNKLTFLTDLNLKWRLSLLFTVFGSLLLFVILSILYKEFVRIQTYEFDSLLYNYTIDIADSLTPDERGNIILDSAHSKIEQKIFPFNLKRTHLAIFNDNGLLLTENNFLFHQTPNFPRETDIAILYDRGFQVKELNFEGKSFRLINYLFPLNQLNKPLILQAIVPMDVFNIIQERYFSRILIFYPIFIIGIFLFSLWFTHLVLAPLKKIINDTHELKIDKLNERIHLPKAKDELFLLSQTINNLLERIELAFRAQERFVQNASHQLKTPLAIIKNEIYEFENNPTDQELQKKFITSTKEEIHSLITLTNNLLLLSKIDASKGNFVFSQINLDEILLATIKRLTPLALKKDIKLVFNYAGNFEEILPENYIIRGDNDLLGALFYNLLENAIKYSINNDQIEISIEKKSNTIEVIILDHGTGIREEKLSQYFERFYRDENVKGKVEGHGLGLSLSKNVSDLHNAKLILKNHQNPHGTKAMVIFNL